MPDIASEPSPVKKTARWVAGAIRLLLGRKLLAPLPAGATLDPAFAETVAADPAKLDAARAYWQQQLALWGGTGDYFAGPAGRLASVAAETPSAVISGVRNGLRSRQQYLLNDGANLVRDELAPLISLADIAKHVAETMPNPIATTSVDVLRQDLAALLSGPSGQPAADPRSVARGIRTARELVDVAKRVRFAGDHHTAHLADIPGASFCEPLALHWIEGGFSVAPSWSSFAAGPLILALPGKTVVDQEHALSHYGYRVGSVFMRDSGAMRPGYIPYYPWQSTWTGPADARFNLNHINEMTLGGMDNILVWYPRAAGTNRDHTTNELWILLTALFTQKSWGAFNHRTVYGHCMVRMEGKQVVPAVAALQEGIDRHNAVLNACVPEGVPTGASNPKYAALKSGDDMKSTREPLSISAEWYRSRRMVRSLVAWRDRGSTTLAGKYLSPFLAYLRYHQGDVLFMRTLLSTLGGLPKLEQSWEQMLRNPSRRSAFDAASANLLTLLGLSGWGTQKQTLIDAAPGWLAAWRTQNVTYHAAGSTPLGETTWRHVGLIAAMRAADPANALLTSIPPVIVDPGLVAVADTARDAVELTTAMGLWPAIDCILQYTPIQKLLEAKVHSVGKGPSRLGRREFVAQISKAENFERRVRYYEFVRSVAGVDAAAH